MKSVQFGDGCSLQVQRRWGQYYFKFPENEHAYRVFVTQSVLPFLKIVSFATLAVGLPEICLLSFQMRAKGTSYCKELNDAGECPNPINDFAWSEESKVLHASAKSWTVAQQITVSLGCLLAMVGLVAFLCKQRADQLKRASNQVDVQEVLSNAFQAKEKGGGPQTEA